MGGQQAKVSSYVLRVDDGSTVVGSAVQKAEGRRGSNSERYRGNPAAIHPAINSASTAPAVPSSSKNHNMSPVPASLQKGAVNKQSSQSSINITKQASQAKLIKQNSRATNNIPGDLSPSKSVASIRVDAKGISNVVHSAR
jgi:hypothetical protein